MTGQSAPNSQVCSVGRPLVLLLGEGIINYSGPSAPNHGQSPLTLSIPVPRPLP